MDVGKSKNGMKVARQVVVCGGMPDECKLNVDWWNFRNGAMYEGKLMGKQVVGGYLLSETTFNIRISD